MPMKTLLLAIMLAFAALPAPATFVDGGFAAG